LVFTTPDGSQVHPEAFSKVFERRVRAWKYATLTVHGLRHSWATAALERGVHPRVVQERLGHSSIAATLGLYSHVSPTLHEEAARAVAGELFG
jgi:integrase